jgi:hypothetical protein
MKMIDPLTVLIATPAGQGTVETDYAGALLSIGAAHMVGNIVFLKRCSDIGLARNLLASNFFLRSPFEWLVFIDADIGFSYRDFALLMDYPPRDGEPHTWQVWEPLPPSVASGERPVSLTPDEQAMLVVADYCRKVPELSVISGGMGFARIHRSVFQALIDMRDDSGAPRIGTFRHKGQEQLNFFPAGPNWEGKWLGEDLGFMYLCALAGIQARFERRTRLAHYGDMVWVYDDEYEKLSTDARAAALRALGAAP